MTAIRWMIVLVFLSVTGCGSSATSLAPAQPPSGGLTPCTGCPNGKIASHAVVFTGMDETAKELLTLAASASHAGMVRMDLTWATLQPSATGYDWHWADESIQAARKYNLEVVALITETPAWASSNPDSPDARFYPPKADQFDEWQAFITAFADRYGAKGTNEIRYWEIWGEANDFSMWKGSTSDYAKLYSLAYDAIKASDPAAQVLMAGMNETDQPNWVEAVLSDPAFPAQNKIDVIDVHVRGSFDAVKNKAAAWKAFFQSKGIVKPLWVTEFGFPSSPTFQSQWNSEFVGTNEADGEQKQADYYNAVIPWLLTDGGVDKLFVTLRDLPNAPDTAWESEGIVTPTVAPKIAFETIKTLSDRFN